ncbi:MAG: hypothetical protein ACSW8C_01030 [bacterium]
MREGNCPCREDFNAPRHYPHFEEWRDPGVDHDCCFNTKNHPVCHQRKHFKSHSMKADDAKEDSKEAKHHKHKKGAGILARNI